MTPIHTRDESGMGGIEGLAFGVLIFVFGTLMVTNAWGVIDAKWATSATAREAARAYVEADSATAADVAASAAANETMTGHHRAISNLTISPGGGYSRCATVVVTAETKVPKVAVPMIHMRAGSYTVTARHVEVVDPYRSGLKGTATCAEP